MHIWKDLFMFIYSIWILKPHAVSYIVTLQMLILELTFNLVKYFANKIRINYQCKQSPLVICYQCMIKKCPETYC